MPVLGRARPVRPQVLRGWVEFVVSTNAPAGDAVGAGDALQPEATVSPNAGGPTGMGAADGTVVNVQALAACPAATGDSSGTTVQTSGGTNAPAGDAFGASEAPQPEASIGAKPQPVGDIVDAGDTATPPTDIIDGGDTTAQITDFYDPEAFDTAAGIAFQATAQIAPLAASPLAAGTALTATADIDVNAGSPTAAGDALQPTVQTTEGAVPGRPIIVSAANATAQRYRRQTFAQFVDLGAPLVAEATNAPAGVASATGTAGPATADIDAKPNTPTAAGSSDGTTVETGAFANAPAGLASATGTAFAASTTIRPNAAVGLAAGLAAQPEAEIGAKAGSPLGAGTAPQPTVLFGAQAPAGLAAATGTAFLGKADIDVTAVGVPAAAGEAGAVFGLVGNPTGPGQPVTVYDSPASITLEGGVGIILRENEDAVEVR